jgi:hypothetical protein
LDEGQKPECATVKRDEPPLWKGLFLVLDSRHFDVAVASYKRQKSLT